MRTHWKGLVLLTGIVLLSGCSSQPKNNWPACAAGGGITWAAGGPWAAVGGAIIGGTACAFGDGMMDDMQRIHFAFDSDKLDNEAKTRLDKLAAHLMKYPEMRVMLSGHTDSIGPASYNQYLSKRRAMSAYLYLRDKGVYESQMQTEALGESSPLTENDSDEGRAMNRRTEVMPLTK